MSRTSRKSLIARGVPALLLFAAACTEAPTTGGAAAELDDPLQEGRRLFDHETFGGNGRTCRTCHSPGNGTLTLEQIADRFAEDPTGPLFRGDGTDDGAGHGTSRIRADGTILVDLALPPGVTVLDDPTADHIRLRHGIPSTMNTPALDGVLMYDGRAPDLIEQARGAIHDHAAPAREPTADELAAIADFQQTRTFFTSTALADFAGGGAPPVLPEGNTESERRGRRFFDDVPLAPLSTRGACAICHSGPMLNESNGFNPIPIPPFFVPAGERFQSILSAELLPNGDPFQAYLVRQPDGSTEVVVHDDPGRALVTGDFRGFPFGNLGQFKIPSLWNVRHTAPYFHNGGAKSLEEVLDHYQRFFAIASPAVFPPGQAILLSDQDKADLIAFLRLL
jgi:cytochrome c peroxidase